MGNFNDIPPELRNRIYFYTESLVPTHHRPTKDSPTWLHASDNSKAPPTKIYKGRIIFNTANRTVQQPAIARVNRKIRGEALPIFFGNNKFRIVRHFGAESERLAQKYVVEWCKMILKYRIEPLHLLFDVWSSDSLVKEVVRMFGADKVTKAGVKKRYRLGGQASDMMEVDGEEEEESGEDKENVGAGVEDIFG